MPHTVPSRPNSGQTDAMQLMTRRNRRIELAARSPSSSTACSTSTAGLPHLRTRRGEHAGHQAGVVVAQVEGAVAIDGAFADLQQEPLDEQLGHDAAAAERDQPLEDDQQQHERADDDRNHQRPAGDTALPTGWSWEWRRRRAGWQRRDVIVRRHSAARHNRQLAPTSAWSRLCWRLSVHRHVSLEQAWSSATRPQWA